MPFSNGVLMVSEVIMQFITESAMHFVNLKRLLQSASRYSVLLGVLLDAQVVPVLQHFLVRLNFFL